jgi:hypothetical protein
MSATAANVPELLVPIRVHLDIDNYKIREQFVWNVNDPVVTVRSCIFEHVYSF